MRTEYLNALRHQFESHIKAIAPQFIHHVEKSNYLWKDESAFEWTVSHNLKCWIVLSPSKNEYNEFTILIGWSKLGRYPELEFIPSIENPDSQNTEFKNTEYLIWLPKLWTTEIDDMHWAINDHAAVNSVIAFEKSLYPIEQNKADSIVEPFINDAVKKLSEYAMPYFEKFTADHQYDKMQKQNKII